jgi:glycosyltransferase involved in cell wall biosynthesis
MSCASRLAEVRAGEKLSRLAMREKTPEPVVDVGIPAYLRPTYIIETIESVLAQTFPSWRLTVSDDGPGAGDVQRAVEPYLADPRVRYVPTGQRLGVSGNWTRIIQLANAPYVAILHDDDRWQPDFLSQHVGFLTANPNCGFVFSGTNRIDHAGHFLSHFTPPLAPGIYTPKEIAPLLLRRNLVGSTPAVLVRRDAYQSVGPFFDGSYPHCDYEMWIRLALSFPVGYLGICSADYRTHEASTTYRIRPDGRNVARLADHFIELADRKHPGLLTQADRRQIRSEVLLEALSFDALGAGDRRYASYLLLRAVRSHPRAAVDSRALDCLRVLVGRRIRRPLARLRRAFSRRAC